LSSTIAILSEREDLVIPIISFIRTEFPNVHVVLARNADDIASEVLKQLQDKSKNIIVVNTVCTQCLDNKLAGCELLRVVNFCFCCLDVEYGGVYRNCIPPYIGLARLLLSRAKILFKELNGYRVSIKISNRSADFIARLHHIEPEHILNTMAGCLIGEEMDRYNISICHTSILDVSLWGLVHGTNRRLKINSRLLFKSSDEILNEYLTQIGAFLALWLSHENLGLARFTVEEIGRDEGAYTYIFSKLIQLGCDYRIEIM